jgi:hypothetical protein
MQKRFNYKSLKHTLLQLKKQVEDSLPHVGKYVPSDIETPEELFYFLRENVKYKKDPKGIELLQTVQTLMSKNNYHGKPGAGDCDCFTILVLASNIHLDFGPQQVALVGKSKISPSHIYSLVYDEEKNKMCAMDLTNPYYCMERSYPYKQTLNFMILELADDNFIPLAGKSSRKAKRAIRKEGQKLRVAARVNKRTAKTENKSLRRISSQERRTDRRVKKGERKGLKRQIKVARKDNKLLRVQGRGEAIQARTDEKLLRIATRSREASNDDEYNPESDASYIPNEAMIPGSTYQASQAVDYEEAYPEEEEYDEYEMLPEEEEEYYEEQMEEGLSLPFLPALFKNIVNKVKAKKNQVQSSRVAGIVNQGTSKYNEIVGLKNENLRLTRELESASNKKYIYAGVSSLVGAGIGYAIARSSKRR